tara:strand:- start:37 stop:561 length:525 start_codon:yes stop_codon:yes gene_type:complete
MASTISFPTAVSANSIGADEWFADDGTLNSSLYNAAVGDITLSAFNSLSIPADATIDGIEINIEGAGNPGSAGIPEMKVYNGTSWSSGRAFSAQFVKAGGTYEPGWGNSSQLWGLSWNAQSAAAIEIQIDASTFDSGGYYWDWLKVKITYTAVAVPKSLTINGLLTINGQLTIK